MALSETEGPGLPEDVMALLEEGAEERVSDDVQSRIFSRVSESVASPSMSAPSGAEGAIVVGTGNLAAIAIVGVVFVVGALVQPGQGPPAIEVVPGVTPVESKEAPTARGVRLAATPMKAAPEQRVATSPLIQAPGASKRGAGETSAHAAKGVTPAPELAATTVSHVPKAPSRDLVKERGILDEARGALRQGKVSRALTLVSRHRKRYPRGALVEERESLWVSALVDAGKSKNAIKRGARFLKRYPRSIHRASVERSLERARR